MKGSRQCFGIGKEHVCVFSQDKIEAQLIWCVEPKILILMLLMIIQKSQSETYWAFVPGPPSLHPAVWKERRLCWQSTITQLLDWPATQEFQIT